MKHWWNDTTGENRSSHRKTLSQYHSVHHEWHGLARDRTQASAVGGWRLTERATGTPLCKSHVRVVRLDVQSLISSRCYLLRPMNRFLCSSLWTSTARPLAYPVTRRKVYLFSWQPRPLLTCIFTSINSHQLCYTITMVSVCTQRYPIYISPLPLQGLVKQITFHPIHH
jgi:hypothetical protein